jgi:hypothetical protein
MFGMDAMVQSEEQGKYVEHFEGPQPEQQKQRQKGVEDTAGVPTGIAPELEAQLAKRRKRKPPPDDFAAGTTA